MITKSIVSSSAGWDEAGDYGDIFLYDAVLAIDTKKFKKGDKVSSVAFMFSCGVCQIWDKTGKTLENGVQEMQVVEEFPIRLEAEITT
jgi:hypothetical protein